MLNIFTAVTGDYNSYIPLFALSHLYYNDDAIVEVRAFEVDRRLNRLSHKLCEVFGDRFCLAYANQMNDWFTVRKDGFADNALRFINRPYKKADHVYITDADIFCMQSNVYSKMLRLSEMIDKPYFNIARKNSLDGDTPRLTGLHFSEWDAYYPIPDELPDGLKGHDEALLYWLVSQRCKIDHDISYRPVFGIHASPNREPFGEPGWGLPAYFLEWKYLRNTNEFKAISEHFDDRLNAVVDQIDKSFDEWFIARENNNEQWM